MNSDGTDTRVDYSRVFTQAIDRLHAEGRYRVFIDILRNKGMFPNARCFAGHNGPKPITVWCSNDYLAMGQHPDVIAAMEEALHDVGAGSGGTRNIGGNTHYHVDLEHELADLHGKEGALLFTSGYVSNEATLSTLAKILPGCVIFSDELNHASMIAGIRNSGAEKKVWRHNDVAHLEELLAETDPALVRLEMDFYWMARAGKDPLAYFREYPGRFPLVHLKNMSADGSIAGRMPLFAPAPGPHDGDEAAGHGDDGWAANLPLIVLVVLVAWSLGALFVGWRRSRA